MWTMKGSVAVHAFVSQVLSKSFMYVVLFYVCKPDTFIKLGPSLETAAYKGSN